MLTVERVLVLFPEMCILRVKHYVKVVYTSPLHFLSHYCHSIEIATAD